MPHDHTIEQRFEEVSALLAATQVRLVDRIRAAANLLSAAYRGGHGVFVFGNGGSAADAQHIAGELVGRFLKDRRSLKAQALTTDAAIVTAVANDFSFEQIFVRQLEGCAGPGDVAWGLSTSGNSANVVAAMRYAKEHGMKTLALTGEGGGRCAAYADILLDVPARMSPRVQEAGTLIYHILCELVEAEIAREDGRGGGRGASSKGRE
jgi:D-sedoheptulose 7-phosphate isomerase